MKPAMPPEPVVTPPAEPVIPVVQPLSPVTPPRKLPWWLWVVVPVVFVVAALGSWGYATYRQISVAKSDQGVAFDDQKPEAVEPPKPFTVALFGYGGAGHSGGELTDSIMVAQVDTVRKVIALISVPRDLWISLPVVDGEAESYWKINAAYAIGNDDRRYTRKPPQYQGAAGGGALAKLALERVLGFPIDRFVALDFSGFKKSIDVVEGIDVKVSQPFSDSQYPIAGMEDDPCGKTPEDIAALTATLSATLLEKEFTCRYETLEFSKGVHHMDGETALKFARSRHSGVGGGDFNRAARQRAVILATKDKVLQIGFIPKIIPFIGTLTNHLKTDFSTADLEAFINRQAELQEYKIVSMALTADPDNVLKFGHSANGQSILIPTAGEDQWWVIHTWVQDQINIAATASASVATPSAVATSSAKP